ncbi:MAG: DUF6090 family protein [Cyclobacteriaceae bacterium]
MISKNRFTAYLAYAVGEIILVVIGILLAIQVDNWNTARKQRLFLESYAGALINDLEKSCSIKPFSKLNNLTNSVSPGVFHG